MLDTLAVKTLTNSYDHDVLARLAIKGNWAGAADPLSAETSDRKTRIFRHVSRGFVHRGTLYLTLDPAVLMDALGVTEASHKYCVNPNLVQKR